MNPNTDTAIANAINLLAEKFNTTSAHLYEVMRYQAKISAITDIIQYTILAITVYCIYKTYKKESDNGEISYEKGTLYALLAMLLSIVTVIAFFCLPNTIDKMFNPDFWIMKTIVSSFKS